MQVNDCGKQDGSGCPDVATSSSLSGGLTLDPGKTRLGPIELPKWPTSYPTTTSKPMEWSLEDVATDLGIKLNPVVHPKNDGGSADYYELPKGARELQDLIEYKKMNFAVGNIFKAAYRLGAETSHSTWERDLRKIIWFAERELKRIGE